MLFHRSFGPSGIAVQDGLINFFDVLWCDCPDEISPLRQIGYEAFSLKGGEGLVDWGSREIERLRESGDYQL